MAASNTTIVFIPGAFQSPAHFGPIVETLNKHGFEAVALALPSTGRNAAKVPSLESVKFVRSKLRELVVDQRKEVLLVGCSYGGFVASMSVKGFERTTESQKSGIKRVVFVAALLIPENTTMVSSLGGGLPPWAELNEEEGALYPAAACASLFYSDLDDASQKHWAAFFQPGSPRDSTAVVQDSCWDVAVPKTYIHTTNDQIHPLEAQQQMVKEVVKSHADDWTFHTMHSDHSPFLSHVEELALILENYAS